MKSLVCAVVLVVEDDEEKENGTEVGELSYILSGEHRVTQLELKGYNLNRKRRRIGQDKPWLRSSITEFSNSPSSTTVNRTTEHSDIRQFKLRWPTQNVMYTNATVGRTKEA